MPELAFRPEFPLRCFLDPGPSFLVEFVQILKLAGHVKTHFLSFVMGSPPPSEGLSTLTWWTVLKADP